MKTIEKKIAAQSELYAQVSADYEKLAAADPLNHDCSNIAVMTGLMGYRTEILAHKETLKALQQAYEKINELEKENEANGR